MVLGSWAIDLSCIQSNKSSRTSHPEPICLIQCLSPYWSISLEGIYSIQRAIHWQGIINPVAWRQSKITFCCYSPPFQTLNSKGTRQRPLLTKSNCNYPVGILLTGSGFKELWKHFSLIINTGCYGSWSSLSSNEATGSEMDGGVNVPTPVWESETPVWFCSVHSHSHLLHLTLRRMALKGCIFLNYYFYFFLTKFLSNFYWLCFKACRGKRVSQPAKLQPCGVREVGAAVRRFSQ